MKESVVEKARTFDPDKTIKRKVDAALENLKNFGRKYPFTENPNSIENLTPEDIIKDEGNQTGEFFLFVQYHLDDIGHLLLYTNEVYYHIKRQLDDFKELLHTVVDKGKSLAEKIDAPWADIKGLGGDRHIAKKIVFCFNYENGDVLPIFKTTHLEHFVDKVVEKPSTPVNYYSLGEKWEYLISKLLKVKDELQETQSWSTTYFSWFLYETYPPPNVVITEIDGRLGKKQPKGPTNEQIEFGKFTELLCELQRKGKISGEQFRQNRERWKNNNQDRGTLIEQLGVLLK
jgi:hypothetical protein